MKTLESIREEIWEEMLYLEDKRTYQWVDIRYQTLREVLQKLGHLDEPEVIDIKWLKNKINELPIIFAGFSVLKQREEFAVIKDDLLELIDQVEESE